MGNLLYQSECVGCWQWFVARSCHHRREMWQPHGLRAAVFDPHTRELLRTRPQPTAARGAATLQRASPPVPVPGLSTEPIPVPRRTSNTDVPMVAWQKVSALA
jgi:hypothetical protein